jgi:adenine-specific DNA-methyltransferase
MIKYLGSKRRLVPVLTRICQAAGARTALDLFTGTTRVAQAFKAQGVHVTAVDSARYAHTFARAYIETDAATIDRDALQAAVSHLNAVPGKPGYVTETFSHEARFFQPHNAARIDAVRDVIDSDYARSPLFPLVLTSLIEAADRVDSTTGVQMAYVKQWAPRSAKPLELRVPELLDGPGLAIQGDAVELASGSGSGSDLAPGPGLGHFDLAYLDPPYNQHRYFTNYHVWETLVAWDAPEAYGVARKRLDARDPSTHSVFNSKRTMPAALASVVQSVDCDLLVLSYNNESWLALEELEAMCSIQARGVSGTSGVSDASGAQREVATLAFDSTRYVGARIGIFDPSGRKVGRVSHLSNQELVVIAGDRALVRRVVEAAGSGASPAASGAASGAAVNAVAPTLVDRLQQAT